MSAAGVEASDVGGWLEPLGPAVCELDDGEFTALRRFGSDLRDILAHPAAPAEPAGLAESAAPAGSGRVDSARLLDVRRALSRRLRPGLIPAQPRPGELVRDALRQTLRQVICGYHDLDLRDSSGLGHGRMIDLHGSPACRARWLPALHAGELAGVAMTEATGGTRIQPRNTHLLPDQRGGWVLVGQKTWISRLNEAAVFVVSAAAPDGSVALVAVDAADSRISREPHEPGGLAGWSWGFLRFDRVPLEQADVLTLTDGMAVLKSHFAYYRPLVTATALGGAAAVHDLVRAWLVGRQQRAEIQRVRDHALIALGATHARINTGLLGALHAARLAATHHPAGSLWARTAKAHGIDTARRVADELVAFTGAAGFADDHRLKKIRRDLDALRYADGMHDGLNRSAGRELLDRAGHLAWPPAHTPVHGPRHTEWMP